MGERIFALISITLTAVAQILLKYGTTTTVSAATAPFAQRLVRMGLNPYIWGGLAVYGVSTVFWLMALSHLKLSVAYPMVSLSYVLVVFGSYWLLGEGITVSQMVGLGLIVSGVLFLMR